MLVDACLRFQDIKDPVVCHDILTQSVAFGVGRYFCLGVSPEDWSLVDMIARDSERVVPFNGVHPWYAEGLKPGWDTRLERYVKKQMTGGIGEIGLDVAKDGDLAKQKEIFRRQFAMAERFVRPAVISCSPGASSDLLEVLRARRSPRTRFLVHAFSGSPEMLDALLKENASISFSWESLRQKRAGTMELVRRVPLTRLFVETGFPRSNEPKGSRPSAGKYFDCLRNAYGLAAEAYEIPVEIMEHAIWENAEAFLSL